MEKLYVIKIGGNVIDKEEDLNNFLESFASLAGNKILVHGGGKHASALEKKLNIPTQMIDGRRITSKESLDVVCMVYAGLINKNITAKLQSMNCNAIGLCGADAHAISAKKRKPGPFDFGYVGDVSDANTSFISHLLESSITPVFSAITYDGNGGLLNSNADGVAAGIATTMNALYEVHLIYCFEKAGVLMDPDDDNSFMEEISKTSLEQLVAKEIISRGMIPKLKYALDAKEKGTTNVIIGSAACLPELSKNNHGTCIIN